MTGEVINGVGLTMIFVDVSVNKVHDIITNWSQKDRGEGGLSLRLSILAMNGN